MGGPAIVRAREERAGQTQGRVEGWPSCGGLG